MFWRKQLLHAYQRLTRQRRILPASWATHLQNNAKRVGPSNAPLILMLHGCGKPPHHAEYWQNFLAASGYQSLALDSLTPRGINRPAAYCTVCTGLQLSGAARAADIASILATVPTTQPVVLMGWSHGGWAVAEYLHQTSHLPPNLQGVVLVYPYLGLLSQQSLGPWPHRLPTLLAAGGRDRVVPLSPQRQLAATADTQFLFYPSAAHSFDVPQHPNFRPHLAADLQQKTQAWLQQIFAA